MQSRNIRQVWLCGKAGVLLVRIYVADPNHSIMSRLVRARLPRHHIDEEGAYYKALCNLCVTLITRATRVDIQNIMTGKPSR